MCCFCCGRAIHLPELDQQKMVDIRGAWYEECGGQPPGNKSALGKPFDAIPTSLYHPLVVCHELQQLEYKCIFPVRELEAVLNSL